MGAFPRAKLAPGLNLFSTFRWLFLVFGHANGCWTVEEGLQDRVFVHMRVRKRDKTGGMTI